jgi:hypothetical protein
MPVALVLVTRTLIPPVAVVVEAAGLGIMVAGLAQVDRVPLALMDIHG